ncbi:proto-oncogene tyrosine-protein kinase ROS-like [Penaeus japonicus]|uniref:proto-oncogene tyrosine-protein kinase ROS-like n=1 Tax=Penaeus japonicus TaxID=27405 RepID=UPI001C71144C|nr:proto-oncogene tyrosine-protein kinase ROS-like [Penaeus japonicus]
MRYFSFIFQCKDGCLDWREGTRSSCQQICTLHGWESEDTMFCTMGCVYAAQSYIRQIEELIGKPPAPMLVGRSVSGSSVGLRWSGAPEVEDVKYLVQYQQNKGPPEWVYYRPSHPVNATEIIVEDLKPYTKYQFRIAWLLLPRHTPILSNPSSWISTLASGPPRSPPRELRAVPLDWSRVEVTWDPPLFPGGDLISYTLYSKDAEGKQEMRDNIDANSERRYILSELSANTTYILNLTSTNHRGEGPAVVAQVTTYPTAPAVDDGQGYLLLTSGSRILRLGLDIMAAPQHLYNVSDHLNITGMAVYIPYDVIYISDTGGSITQLIPSSKKVYTLLTQNHLHGYPLSLSVDWLYYHLYYIVHLEPTMNNVWQLWRCNLNGKYPVLIYGELHYEPKHLQVDPYNGYIWWISEDLDGGLYRLDMNDNDETREPEIVLSSPELDLGGLVLDPPNFQVLVADRKNNAMLAVSLDGTSVTNLRANTQRAFFQHLKSVAHLNSRFFWTDGSEVYTEELNDGTFYHISYVVMNSMKNTVDVGTLVAVHGSTQPVPVPLNPPTDLQAVFTRTSASLRWNAPALPALMGSRAWQMWRYEVHIQEGRKTISDKNITRTTYQALNLRPGTFYIIKVQAYSLGGKGPWSREFRGRTLDATQDAPQLVWATEDKIVMSNLVGSESSVLVSQETLQAKLKGEKIVDLAFFRDTLVMAVSNQSVVLMNMSASTFAEVPNTHGVLSVSVDWLTQRLFWANPHRQMIGWSSLQGTSQGPLNVVTAAREVRVDALHGRLFWTTPHALLVSSLAGRNVTTIHQEGIFSGKQVYGLTVDTFGARIWWIVRDAEGCKLFGASMQNKVVKFPTKALPQPVMLGPMWYLSERLLWLGEDGDLVVSDTSLNNSAALHTSSLGVLHFTVILPDLQPMPANVLEPHVIPGQIDETSVLVEGTWEEFVLKWAPITNINYGNLLYEVIIDNGVSKKAILTRNNSIPYEEKLPPYSPLKMSVRGITDWSVGTRLIKTIRTPASLPGPPQDLRTFVQKVQDTVAIIHLRWSAPEKPNGEITSYAVIYCAGESEGNCKSVSVEGSQNQVMVENLSSDQVYRFKVAAVNEIGKGPYSSEVTEGLQQHIPTPSLIVVAGEALMKLDADLQEEREILSENSRVQWVSALLSNSSFAWMDMNSDVYITHLTTNYTERLLRLGGQGVGLAADWVGEIIVWAERQSVGSREINIQMLEIEYKTKKSLVKINLSDPIKKFLLSLATSQVLILHESYRGSKLSIVSLTYSTVMQDVFSQERNYECTCSKNPSLVGGVALDTTNLTHPALYFVAGGSTSEIPKTTVVYKTDLHGCDCEPVFVPEDFGYGPCVEIAVDFAHLYCYVGVNQTLLWLPKTGTVSAESLHAQYLYNATSLIPLDLATQPMPEPDCLITSNYTSLPELAGSQETAIAIKLKVPEVKEDVCGSLPLPPVMYTIYYAPVSHSDEGSCAMDVKNCRQRRSTNNVITVDGLQPFTRYVFRASIETVYNNRLGIVSLASPSAIFKTKAKAPESVGKITAEALSPEEIDVSFEAEADQLYEIHWQGETSSSGPLRFHVNATGRFQKKITKLSPNTKYEVWVRVYSKDKLLYTDSPRVAVITLPELPYLKLENATARALSVSWTSPSDHSVLRHVIEYIPRGQTLWKHLSMVQTSPGHKYFANITELVPATSYLLRLRVIYNNTLHSFTWPRKPLFNFTTLDNYWLIEGLEESELKGGGKSRRFRRESSHPHHHHLRNREVELATLRQLPTNNNFVTENNVLYNLHTFPGDDLDLPHVSRHCITLTKFLGSGAFGEVFEGTACELPGLPEVTKVAIKTLRKGATEAEKAEFLKEAQLMSHFQHEHILRLLAVCTDHDPFFLILELMEGGDLLSYLRTSRGAECGLTLADLVAMCVDVAKGCVYLEEMHYVHRDLAARNCLVSTTDPESRIVKIGDFGLARDIYKNDYYRKEGEGLLPVRWMSPESLVDGVFTSHSDVWAFGVLLWEILTLGQQPYPARTNLEVLHYVRSGGRLNRPPNCPEELHKLMERCWSYSPENRPTFKECLSTLLMLEETISALPALAVHNVHYIGSNGPYGLDNLAYAVDRDENHNTNSGNSLVSGNECSATNSWSTQTSNSVANLGPRRGSDQEDRVLGGEAEECDSFSGASTLPLTAPLRRHQQYLQLVNEPSPTSPPVSPRSDASSDWPRFSSSSGEAPQSSASLITAAQVSIPSSPPCTSHASPAPESPTSVTFTFPLPSLQGVVSPQHYLRPSSNKVFAGPSQAGSSETEEELDARFSPAPPDNSYVNMSAGAELKLMDEVTEAADLEKINGVSMRIKRDCDLQAELDSHRLSGLSGLSAVSGMTSASTVDLDHSPSQSWC